MSTTNRHTDREAHVRPPSITAQPPDPPPTSVNVSDPAPEILENMMDEASRSEPGCDETAYETFKKTCDEQFFPDTPMTYPLPKAGNHWKSCHDVLEKHDNYLCQGWNNDIDTLLVFAGLFSAAVTAFTIESYQWLQPDSGDTTVLLLQQISRQLADPNTTITSIPEFAPTSSQRLINIFWFLSLVVALMTALLGILCKQWLREYQKDASVSYKDSVALRQMRFEAFTYWHVENFISALPLLLQLALLLFVVGMLNLLWTLDHITATVITVAAVVGFGFVIVTTVLPVVVMILNTGRTQKSRIPDCSFKSPQAWLFSRASLMFSLAKFDSWLAAEKKILLWLSPQYAYRAIYWLDDNFSQNDTMVVRLANCLQDLPVDQYERSLEGVLDDNELDACVRVNNTLPGISWRTHGPSRILFVFFSRNARRISHMDSALLKHYAELVLRLTHDSILEHPFLLNENNMKNVNHFRNLAQALRWLKDDVDARVLGDAFVLGALAPLVKVTNTKRLFPCLSSWAFSRRALLELFNGAVDLAQTKSDNLDIKVEYMRNIVLDASLGLQAKKLYHRPGFTKTSYAETMDGLRGLVARIRPAESLEWDSLEKALRDE